jgi:hypothetical protein
LIGQALGKDVAEWILDRFAPNSPFWAFPLVADSDLRMVHRVGGEDAERKSTIWVASFAVWTVVLTVLSLRIFNRQEVGS